MFTIPKLPYDYAALEPYIDAKTMEIHYSKHHAAYVSKLNDGLQDYPELLEQNVAELLKNLGDLPETVRSAVRNQGGGHYNHSLFWDSMSAKSSEPSRELQAGISDTFGSFSEFQTKLGDAAIARFGSGWAWLVKSAGKLEVISTANQDSPLSEGKTPLLGLDVWEHAYYLKYQNRRPEYIEAWWNIVNWEEVSRRYDQQ